MVTESPMGTDADDHELAELLPPTESEQDQQLTSQEGMGRDEQWTKPEGRWGDDIALYGAIIGSTVVLLGTWLIVFSNLNVTWFTFHLLLQPLAMVFFTYGIMTLQPTSQPKTKAAGLSRHQLAVFIVGLPLFIIGTLAVFINKWVHEKKHFKSWHGIIGIACMAWVIVQIFVGGGSVWFNGAVFGGGMKAKAVWRYHRISGYILYALMVLTVHLGGAWSHWGEKNAAWFIRLVLYTLSPAVVFVSMLARIRPSKMKIF